MTAAAPLLKWAGGKRQLLPEIRKHIPAKFGRYFEPFVGGGAVFFDLAAAGPLSAVLSDSNSALIATYKAVRDDIEGVIRILERHARKHSEEHYYRTRAVRGLVGAELAAQMIYLNRTCFNGLYRVNRKGEFNVPFGRYANPTICDAENLRACARAFRNVEFTSGDFDRVLSTVGEEGDFVYCDPPYVPGSTSSDFTSYTAAGFTLVDQMRLAKTARDLKKSGVKVLLSNADLPAVRRLYKGFEMRTVNAKRNINSKADRRGAVGELLIW